MTSLFTLDIRHFRNIQSCSLDNLSAFNIFYGENGAGKSTLVKMIYGLVKPDSGQMTLRGSQFSPSEPRAARAAGIAMVFQHFSLF